MRLARALIACGLGAISLTALTAATVDCSACGGDACLQSVFYVNASNCIASIQSDCHASSIFHPCDAGAGGSFVAVLAPDDGGACNVSTTLEDGTMITVQVHWQLLTPANKCCPARYQAEPPSLDIGASDAGSASD